LKRLAPKRVFIIGATGVVSSHVKDQLVGLPSSPSVTRLGGLDRYDTAAKVAEQVAYKLGAASRAVVVPGADYPCALIAAPLAASKGWPILLTQAQTLPDYTSSCLSRLKVQSVLVVGNTSEVSGSVYSRLPGSKQRIYTDSGDRYATAGLVFDYAKQQGLTPARVALAVGGDFPDALSAGPYLARDGGFLLLTGTNALHPQAQSRLTANKLVVRNLDVIGSTLAISDAAVSQAKAALK
jgi:putative cell wall-binding protein